MLYLDGRLSPHFMASLSFVYALWSVHCKVIVEMCYFEPWELFLYYYNDRLILLALMGISKRGARIRIYVYSVGWVFRLTLSRICIGRVSFRKPWKDKWQRCLLYSDLSFECVSSGEFAGEQVRSISTLLWERTVSNVKSYERTYSLSIHRPL